MSKPTPRLTLSRGASESAGHTSWSGKAELGDYVSFYGFMICYLKDLMSEQCRPSYGVDQRLSTVPSNIEGAESLVKPRFRPRLILAGYSYGSMIASHLPGIEGVTKLFENAAEDSAESEIQLRASHLSSHTQKILEIKQELNYGRSSLRIASHSDLGSSKSSSSVLVGGFESEAAEQRIDRESRRSLDVRKSLDRVREKFHPKQRHLPNSNDESDGSVRADIRSDVIVPQICHLLISPILPPVATFATVFSSLSFKDRHGVTHFSSDDIGPEIVKSPSLAVYGSKDFFTSVKKLRKWAQELCLTPGSAFRYHEVEGAGHFWNEAGVLEQLQNCIVEWESTL